ncbi:flagellar basal body P-ring formation chaperone FlgA [Alteromonas sp.]|jgi:flagella basal body P-ring formation protein FlgA|uniref:flagellar basal body P-ring formation chaperone FlgA n=1 Tax=Alteromonas sp. TaxID=232 RepID=UPI000B66BA66|nr:flagellar basal body P-ring formation chaperone FlgA [Alteromonas sp.]MAI38520.1 flagella basal body P-ring formation protein FlgA [Alteromonas sp.]OUX85796.1 MAG: flagella basal body P-ring formation protein FlgA [Alteromonas sp. TMED35]|tara:strand:- start:104323 stop:105039 length:717 start_codon:yes stop_codon:yes gene_type:complete
MKKLNSKRQQKTLAAIALIMSSAVSFSCVATDSLHRVVENGAKDYLVSQLADNTADTNIDVDIVKIDDRINIPECPEGYQYHTSEEALRQSYISVRVSCQNNDWYLFTSGQVSRTKDIVVTYGAVSPGTVLTSSNLKMASVDIKRLRYTTFTNIETLVGARMKRRATNGQAIQANMLCFVCKGDRITISAEVGKMKVKTAGIAQQDGVVGDNIQVLNASSKKTVIARVASVERVVIQL